MGAEVTIIADAIAVRIDLVRVDVTRAVVVPIVDPVGIGVAVARVAPPVSVGVGLIRIGNEGAVVITRSSRTLGSARDPMNDAVAITVVGNPVAVEVVTGKSLATIGESGATQGIAAIDQ